MKAWASALRVMVTSTATQKATVESMVRVAGSSKKGTGQALSVDIKLTLILIERKWFHVALDIINLFPRVRVTLSDRQEKTSSQ
jgi:hypothetical protein